MTLLVFRRHQKLLRTCFSGTIYGRISTSGKNSCLLFQPTTEFRGVSLPDRTTVHRRYLSEKKSSSQAPSWSDLIASRSGVNGGDGTFERPSWSEEWKRLGLGAELVRDSTRFPQNLFFVQLGFGVDQHGDRLRDGFATKAAIRAVRNAIEFNSIPGVIDHVPGGRKGMLIHVKLGVPPPTDRPLEVAAAVDALEVAKVFPYGKLLPIEIVTGGLDFHSGRVVEELGDDDDVGVCCVACVSIGYNNDSHDKSGKEADSEIVHKTYSTKDGY